MTFANGGGLKPCPTLRNTVNVAPWQDAIDALADAAARGVAVDPAALAEEVPELDVAAVTSLLARAIHRLPAPIGPTADGPAVARRRALEMALAHLEARCGQSDRLVRVAREAWLRGGRHSAYLRVLLECGHEMQAVVLARSLLARRDCADRAAVEALLAEAAAVPEGWADAVKDFAEDPTPDAWRALQRFTPADVYDQRVRYTLRMLADMGVHPEVVFRFATLDEATPDAVELAEEGLVDPRLIVERGHRSTPEGRALWFGLAARCACVRGDRLGTVRLLRDAFEHAVPPWTPKLDLQFVRENADPELAELLDSVGFPR